MFHSPRNINNFSLGVLLLWNLVWPSFLPPLLFSLLSVKPPSAWKGGSFNRTWSSNSAAWGKSLKLDVGAQPSLLSARCNYLPWAPSFLLGSLFINLPGSAAFLDGVHALLSKSLPVPFHLRQLSFGNQHEQIHAKVLLTDSLNWQSFPTKEKDESLWCNFWPENNTFGNSTILLPPPPNMSHWLLPILLVYDLG